MSRLKPPERPPLNYEEWKELLVVPYAEPPRPTPNGGSTFENHREHLKVPYVELSTKNPQPTSS